VFTSPEYFRGLFFDIKLRLATLATFHVVTRGRGASVFWERARPRVQQHARLSGVPPDVSPGISGWL
jgi:hypothetical protein